MSGAHRAEWKTVNKHPPPQMVERYGLKQGPGVVLGPLGMPGSGVDYYRSIEEPSRVEVESPQANGVARGGIDA